jgi:hypothetical protein
MQIYNLILNIRKPKIERLITLMCLYLTLQLVTFPISAPTGIDLRCELFFLPVWVEKCYALEAP